MNGRRWSRGCNIGGVKARRRPPVYLLPMLFLCGCIQVSAPDKPIVIDLNINIKQEVVYRLDSKAQELIQQQTEIF